MSSQVQLNSILFNSVEFLFFIHTKCLGSNDGILSFFEAMIGLMTLKCKM